MSVSEQSGTRRDDLIETLWNVKRREKNVDGKAERDLIETLWNVKCNR